MSSQRLVFIDSVRGLAMLGVIGIHTGSYTLLNPYVNVHLFALLEISSRFSVPIFFFLSAFGLFLNQSLKEPFSFKSFLQRRLRSVLLPYIVWSFIYLLHGALVVHDYSFLNLAELIKILFFGLASYQLYFMVLLIWFYLLMPFWRYFLKILAAHPLILFPCLLVGQILFNYYSCYELKNDLVWPWLQSFIQYRLNFWVLHYVFIFMVGAYLGLNWPNLKVRMQQQLPALTLFFTVTLVLILGHYYTLLWLYHYTPEQAVNTVQQLSPFGVLYTLGASLFLLTLFSTATLPSWITAPLTRIGRNSNILYLVHPLIMYYAITLFLQHMYTLTALAAIIFYTVVLLGSLLFAWFLKQLTPKHPWLTLLLTGAKTKKAPNPH